MEEFLMPPYNCRGYPGYFPFYPGHGKFKHQNWNKKGNNLYVAPDAPDYFDVYKCAQLKAILSQVNPSLTPRLRKANTREFGVPLKDTLPSTPVNSVRFSRPVAIYSPVFDRRIFSLSTTAGESKDDGGDESKRTDSETDDDEKCKPDELPHNESLQGKSVVRRNKRSNFQVCCREIYPKLVDILSSYGFIYTCIYFLEQKYGFYHCSKCNIRWESAFVWCISGTSKVYFKQHCRKCQAGLNPYRVESIQCQVCCKTRCCCERKQRHIDTCRPHRQDLCGRCKGKGLSCDTIYSFKYIV
uniref:Zygote arrest 1-like n=1 Tax=Cyprinus carpio TaxID=7962 RepID=A0A8C1VUY4_CYPCA